MKTLRHLLTLNDISPRELTALLRDAAASKRTHRRTQPLAGKIVALVFQKPSMRTRVAFEVAVLQLGGSTISLAQDDIQLGTREPIKDVARALSRYVDAIVVRTFTHADAQEFATYASVPVINGLSDLAHPCQTLADLLTIQEACGRIKGVQVAYVGDSNNVLRSLLVGCAMMGAHVAVATPKRYRPPRAFWQAVCRQATRTGARLSCGKDPHEAVRGADILYTDVWVSMGQEREATARRTSFRPYQVNRELLARAKPRCRVMHCLPAHRGEEITDDVMESRQSLVFDQAENRLHAHKALLKFLLAR